MGKSTTQRNWRFCGSSSLCRSLYFCPACRRRRPPVRLVGAVAAQGLPVAQARKGCGDIMACHLTGVVNQRLDHSENGFLLRERHFEIDLRGLGLAVGAKILVAEAAHNLEIL